MFSLFGSTSELDEDFFQWTILICRWVIENFGGLDQLRKTPLVTPSAQYFPASNLTGPDRAKELFEQVKALADMSNWDCDLHMQAVRAPDHIADTLVQKFEQRSPAGTFSETVEGDRIVSAITYDPRQLKYPEELIATFSHELAHLLMTSASTECPFPEDELEPVTDGLAILMGFGVFIANGSSAFRTDSLGWEYHRTGYLCEGEILHALSAFIFLSGNQLESAKPWLKPHLYKRLCKIHAVAAKREELRNLATA